jgi:hypothetical protein
MRKNDIRTGVVYAEWNDRAWRTPEPIAFLAEPRAGGPLYARRSHWEGPGAYFREATTGRSSGYPAVRGHPPEHLLEVTLADFTATRTARSGTAEYVLVGRFAGIWGRYDDAVAVVAARNAELEQRLAAEAEADTAADIQATAIAAELIRHGITSRYQPPDRYNPRDAMITLDLANAGRLAGILRSLPAERGATP